MQSNVFDPADFFSLANLLVQSPSNEAQARSAISRAYYACYLTARDQMFGVDHRQLTDPVWSRISQAAGLRRARRAGSHEVIILALAQNANIRTPGLAKQLSDSLDQLKGQRVQADYYRDPSHQNTVALFAQHSVSDWSGLGHQALALAAQLLPDLRRVPSF